MPKLHPDKCIKYCRFGFDQSKGGCSGNCSLLHPTLCRNSLEYKQCYCENCTFAHLSGTERSQKDILPQQFQPSSNLYQNHSSYNGHGHWTVVMGIILGGGGLPPPRFFLKVQLVKMRFKIWNMDLNFSFMETFNLKSDTFSYFFWKISARCARNPFYSFDY